jgi:hypothetical protein
VGLPGMGMFGGGVSGWLGELGIGGKLSKLGDLEVKFITTNSWLFKFFKPMWLCLDTNKYSKKSFMIFLRKKAQLDLFLNNQKEGVKFRACLIILLGFVLSIATVHVYYIMQLRILLLVCQFSSRQLLCDEYRLYLCQLLELMLHGL